MWFHSGDADGFRGFIVGWKGFIWNHIMKRRKGFINPLDGCTIGFFGRDDDFTSGISAVGVT